MMPDNPVYKLRRRIARAIDWRVEAAVNERVGAIAATVAAHEIEVRSVIRCLEDERRQHRTDDAAMLDIRLGRIDTRFNGVDDVLRTADKRHAAAERRDEQVDSTIDRLRTSLVSLSTALTDGQRGHTDLLIKVVSRLDGLERLAEGRPSAPRATTVK